MLLLDMLPGGADRCNTPRPGAMVPENPLSPRLAGASRSHTGRAGDEAGPTKSPAPLPSVAGPGSEEAGQGGRNQGSQNLRGRGTEWEPDTEAPLPSPRSQSPDLSDLATVGPIMAFPEPKPKKPELPKKLVQNLECKQGAVRAVRFNVDGNYCLTCGSDKSLKLWNPHKGTLLKTYSGHGYEVLDAAGSFNNSQLCSCGADKTVALWDVASGQVIRKFRGHAGKVNCVQFNEEATVILSGSIDSSVRCWDCRSRRPDPIQILDEAKDGVSSLKVSDYEILSGSVDGRVRRYDLRAGELYSDYIGSPVTSVCFSKDGQCTLAASLDSTLRLLDKDTGELLGEYTGHKNTAYKLDCCLSEKDTHVASCSEDGKVYFWDLVEGSLTLSLPVGRGVVQSLSFHPSEPGLLTATEGRVQFWREETHTAEEQPPAC